MRANFKIGENIKFISSLDQDTKTFDHKHKKERGYGVSLLQPSLDFDIFGWITVVQDSKVSSKHTHYK